MGKKKFDSKKGVTFKLIYKSSDDQDSSADKTLSERIFSVIEQQKKTAIQENDKERQQILSQFTKEELGQAKPKRKKDPNAVNNAEHSGTISTHAKGRDDLWITHLHRMKEAAKAQLDQEEEEEEEEEERKKVEMSKKQALLEKLRNKAFKKTAASQLKKAKETEEGDGEDDGEGWESCEDEGEEGDDDEEEIEDVEEWEEEEEDEEEEEYEEIEIDEETMKEMQRQQQEQQEETEEKEEEPIRLTKAKDPVEENKKGGKTVFEEIQQTKAPQVHFEDFPTLGTGEVMEFAHESVDIPMPPKPEEKTAEQKVEETAEAEIDLKRTIVQGDVKMQRFDEMGLPIDGYNYYQHVVDANSGGQPQFAFTVTYDHVVNLPEDNDFRLEKMNVEERELYEALEHENQDGAYEDLDDDFFGQITKESNVKLEDGYFDPRASNFYLEIFSKNPQEAAKKVTFVEGEVTEISTTKEEVGKKEEGKGKGGKDSVLQRQDFNKVLDEHVAALKNRFRNERERNKARYGIESSDEDEDVEEVDDFSDEEDKEEDDGVREIYDQIPFEKDVAMQQVMKKDLEADSEEDEHVDDELFDERRSTKSSKTGQATLAESEIFSLARKAKLNIIKEKRAGEKEREPRKEEKEEESEDEEEEDDKGKVEEVFKKRERGETKEERKQRKEAVKQFKQDRKDKKKKFKENFDSKKKEHLKINQRQATSLQGQTIYKLTV